MKGHYSLNELSDSIDINSSALYDPECVDVSPNSQQVKM